MVSPSLVAGCVVGLATCFALVLYTGTHSGLTGELPGSKAVNAPLSQPDDGLNETCSHVFVPFNSSCPRLLKSKISTGSGLGHQVTELLFALQKARSNGLSYVYEPIIGSEKHTDNYTFINDLLGLPRSFSSLGGASSQRADQIVAKTNSTWMILEDARPPDGCNLFRYVAGYFHCSSNVTTGNCFYAPENEFLYQNSARCLQRAVATHGTAFNRCIFNNDEFTRATSNRGEISNSRTTYSRVLPSDTIIVVWHVRVGDIVLHEPGDPFYERVLVVLREITQGYNLQLHMVGKGGRKQDDTHSVAHDYVNSLQRAVGRVWPKSAGNSLLPRVQAPNLSFRDTFMAMMQADVLIGSGSSLPAVAALMSGEPLFFNHVSKSGYKYGIEMLANSVDLEANGTVRESRRRLKVAMHERMQTRNRRACGFTR